MRTSALITLAVMLLLCVTGCSTVADRYADRYGPSPVLSSADVDISVQDHLRILGSLAQASGLALPSLGAPDWYLVTEAGFNYVDERCDKYVTDLFIANRDKDKAKGLEVLADKASSAVLFATGASKEAIAIAAQAFGFAEGATDLVANSYLFQIDPASIQNLVSQMRRAYRQQAYEDRRYFNSPTAAFSGVQKYLELCLPQTIESKINGILARTKAFPDTTAGAASISVLLAADPPLSQSDAATFQDLPQSAPSVRSWNPGYEAPTIGPRSNASAAGNPTPVSDESIKKVLRTYIYAGGKVPDPARQTTLTHLLEARRVRDPLGAVVFAPDLSAVRRQLAHDAGLIPSR